MMNEWKERIEEMRAVRDELYQADREQMWEYYHPEEATERSEILSAQEKLQINLSQDYIDFLLCANGWKCFYQLVDLFGTKDFDSEMMSYARELLNVELEYHEELRTVKEYLLPIAVSRTDKDLFVMVLAEGREHGQVVWLAGGEIERFDSFGEFFEAMIEYNQGDLEDMEDDVYSEVKALFEAYPVGQEEIMEAEKSMGIVFPSDLKNFYKKVGYGFVNNEMGAVNRLIDPLGCSAIRQREDFYEYDPDLEMYESYEENSLIFFEVNEGVYISIGLDDNKIYFTDKVIAESLLEFLGKIKNPDYWNAV